MTVLHLFDATPAPKPWPSWDFGGQPFSRASLLPCFTEVLLLDRASTSPIMSEASNAFLFNLIRFYHLYEPKSSIIIAVVG